MEILIVNIVFLAIASLGEFIELSKLKRLNINLGIKFHLKMVLESYLLLVVIQLAIFSIVFACFIMSSKMGIIC